MTSNRPVSEMVERLWGLHRRGLSYASDKPAVNLLLADLSEGIADAARALAASSQAPSDAVVERPKNAHTFRTWLAFQAEIERNAPTGLTAAQRLTDALERFDAIPSAVASDAVVERVVEEIHEWAWATAAPGETSTETFKRAIERALLTAIPSAGGVEAVKRAAHIVGQIHAQLQYYDYLLPGDFVPDPPMRKRWFRWRPAFAITDDMLIWAGTIARARSLMDLKSAVDAIADATPNMVASAESTGK